MRRQVFRVLGIGLLVGIVIWATLYWTRTPVTQIEALQFARQRLDWSGERLGFDPFIFQGPAPIEVGGAAYSFQWSYSDNKGQIEIIISVDNDGGTEIAFNGDIERLRKQTIGAGNPKRRNKGSPISRQVN